MPTEDGESLRVGCLEVPGPFFMAHLITAFARARPQTRLDLVEADLDGLRDAVRRSAVELAITYDVDLGRDLDVALLAELHPHVVLAGGHPLTRKAELTLDDLAGEPMVLLDTARFRERQLAPFRAIGREPRVVFGTRSFEMARSLVANGLGYAILLTKPANNMSYDGKALVARSIVDHIDTIRLVLIRRRAAAPSPAGQAFATLCRDYFCPAHAGENPGPTPE